ncbi:enoyl-CoA hydratase/isomerase family protein [Paenibacillus sp. P36]|uniref:enoyl-CoA hydratase/isomerase family protein n=1 Tax=Paenibacillus sp. P36 TaxID=3342538 RepID=UPI0038B3C396
MSSIQVDDKEGIYYILMNNPETKNSLDLAMATELYEAVREANENPSCNAIVFLSKARAFFSSGPALDELIELSTLQNGAALLSEVVEKLNQVILEIYHSPKLTIAGVHGYAYGGGLNIMLACDYRIAEEKAKFIENFHYMGFTPDLSASYFLPRYIGLSHTMELLLTGRMFTAKEVADWGLFHDVVEKRAVMLERIDTLCRQFVQGESRNLQRMKELLRTSFYSTLEEHLEKEKRYLTDCLNFPELTGRLKSVAGMSLTN